MASFPQTCGIDGKLGKTLGFIYASLLLLILEAAE